MRRQDLIFTPSLCIMLIDPGTVSLLRYGEQTLDSTPSWVLAKIQHGREARVDTNGPRFSSNRPRNSIHQAGVKTSREPDTLGKERLFKGTNTVETFSKMHQRHLKSCSLQIQMLD